VASTLRSLLTTLDDLSSRMLGRDGSVRNVRAQLDEQRRSCEQVEVLRRRLLPAARRVTSTAA
jgi:hypothetical protein